MIALDKEILKNIARKLKQIRKEKGLTQDDLAFEAEISRSTIGMLETAKRDITVTKLVKIAKALNIEPYELLKFK